MVQGLGTCVYPACSCAVPILITTVLDIGDDLCDVVNNILYPGSCARDTCGIFTGLSTCVPITFGDCGCSLIPNTGLIGVVGPLQCDSLGRAYQTDCIPSCPNTAVGLHTCGSTEIITAPSCGCAELPTVLNIVAELNHCDQYGRVLTDSCSGICSENSVTLFPRPCVTLDINIS